MIPHWLAWPLMLLGIWYLPLPLGGYYWSAYIFGLVLAVGVGIWARRSFRVVRLESSDDATVLRIERRRKPRGARTRRIVRVAAVALVGLLALTAVVSQLVAKPRADDARAAAIPPNLHDDGQLPSIEGPSGKSRVEPTFTHVAAVISGYGTEVRCWSVADWRKREAEWGRWRGRPLGAWGGYTARWPWIPNAYRIHLSPSICASLVRLAYEDVPVQEDPWPEALAWSVAALAHESQHVRGIGNEARAECYGVQAIQRTTEALGRSASEGRYLAALYWRDGYSKQTNEEYRSDECRDGGKLDVRPETHVWP
jgi:hypothetical protein